MTIGQVVDFVIAYNERQKEAEEAAKKAAETKEKKSGKRRATQDDINAFFG